MYFYYIIIIIVHKQSTTATVESRRGSHVLELYVWGEGEKGSVSRRQFQPFCPIFVKGL